MPVNVFDTMMSLRSFTSQRYCFFVENPCQSIRERAKLTSISNFFESRCNFKVSSSSSSGGWIAWPSAYGYSRICRTAILRCRSLGPRWPDRRRWESCLLWLQNHKCRYKNCVLCKIQCFFCYQMLFVRDVCDFLYTKCITKRRLKNNGKKPLSVRENCISSQPISKWQSNNSSNAETKIRHISRMEHSGRTVPWMR